MKNKLLSLLLLTILLSILLLPMAAEASPASDDQLAYAYIQASTSYMTIEDRMDWKIQLPVDSSSYTFKYTLYYHPEMTMTKEIYQAVSSTEELRGDDKFSFTPTKQGKYFLEAELSDDAAGTITLQSQPLFTYKREDRNNPTTLPGKLKTVADECLSQNLPGDYEKAVWLHDWIIHHADYDESLTIHHPQGVLLQGSGVCESYALAYGMLLQEVAIQSIYVTGAGRSQPHAWNLVLLEDEWYHVDTTWDDPVGGKENHNYFGLTDGLMKRDHDWRASNFIFPVCNSLQYNYNLRNGYRPFDVKEDLNSLLSKALNAWESPLKYTYCGFDSSFDLGDEINKWMAEYSDINFVKSWSFSGDKFAGIAKVSYLDLLDYHSFNDEAEMIQIIQEQLISHNPLIQIYYRGSDKLFDIGPAIKDWLPENFPLYDVLEYGLSYTQYKADITLSYDDYSAYSIFSDDTEFDQVMDDQLTGRQPLIQIKYKGNDKLFHITQAIEKWLSANSRRYSVTGYESSSSQYTADISLSYGDYSAYHSFKNDHTLEEALLKAYTDKESPLKLHYEGEDPNYNLSSKLQLWFEQNQEMITDYTGTAGSFEASLDIIWK